MLPDGSYDAIVVDAADACGGVIAVELAVLGGIHKGAVVPVRVTGLQRDPLDLLAAPATLTVAEGNPSLHLEG